MAESLGAAKLTLSVDDQRFQAGLQRAELSAKSAGAAISKGLELAGVGLGAAAVLAFAKSCADAGLAADAAERRLSLLSGRFSESADAAQVAAKAAQQLGITNREASGGIAELYGRLRPLGLSLDDIQTLYTGLSAASKNLGLDAGSTQAAITQLAQGLGSGALQGDELRSVLEQLPPVAQAIAQTLGVPVGQLKNLGSQGLITNEVVLTSIKRLKEFEVASLNLETPQQKVTDLGNAFENLQISISKVYGPATIQGVNALTVAVKTLQLAIDPKAVAEISAALQEKNLNPTGTAQKIDILTAAIKRVKEEFFKSAGGSGVLLKQLAALQAQLDKLKNPPKPVTVVAPEQLNTVEKLSAKITALQAAGKKLDFGSAEYANNARQVFDLQRTLSNITADQFTEKDKIVSASKEELNAAIELSAYQDKSLVQSRAIAQSRITIARAAKEAKAANENVDIARRSNDPKRLETATLALNDSGNRLKTAMIEGGTAAKNALLEAAEATKNAVKAVDSAKRSAFDLLTNSEQGRLLSQAASTVQQAVRNGTFDRFKVEAALGTSIYSNANPGQLFDAAGKAGAIDEANKALVKATQDQTKATLEQSKITQAFNEASATLVGVLVNAILYKQAPKQAYLP